MISHLFSSDDPGARTTLPVLTSGLSQNRDIRVQAEVVHICNTKKRIRFREVKLQPKTTSSNLRAPPPKRGAQTQKPKPSAQNGEDGELLYPEASETQSVQEDLENEMEVDSEAS